VLIRTGDGNVDSTVSGDNQGNLVQGRDFHGPLNFGAPSPPTSQTTDRG
jgi:hypothetical protein